MECAGARAWMTHELVTYWRDVIVVRAKIRKDKRCPVEVIECRWARIFTCMMEVVQGIQIYDGGVSKYGRRHV